MSERFEKRWGGAEITLILDAVAAPLRDLTPGSFSRIGGRDLLSVAAQLQQVSRLVFAAELVVTDEIHAQGLAQAMGSPSTTALLVEHLLIPRSEARSRLAAATTTLSQDSMTGGDLDPVLPELGAAIAEGTINPDQVRSIVDTMKALPTSVDDETRSLAERLMVEAGVATPPAPFARFCRQVAAQLDQDGELPADKARDNVSLALGRRNNRTGLTPLTGQLDDHTVELLNKALDGLAAPRPTAECGPDPRPGALRRGQAFGEMLSRYLNLGDAPTDHGVRPHISVTMTLDGLQAAFDQATAFDEDTAFDQDSAAAEKAGPSGGSAAGGVNGAVYDSGNPITPAMLRQLLCDAAVLPIVLGGNGEILDVGRERRTFTLAMRKALTARDRGCAWPGCDRPASWCDGHHVDPWSAMNGETSVDNGALLCQHHHTEIHRGDWTMRMSGGIPEFLPPIWIDPQQKWRRNNLHRPAPPAEKVRRGPTGSG